MKIRDDFRGYRKPSLALTEHLMASSPFEDLNSPGIRIFTLAKNLKSFDITS
jgi:hypothetical protein